MNEAESPVEALATSLVRWRQMRSLQAVEAAAAELLQRLKSADPAFFAQPGMSIFPKKIFVTDEGSPPLPDGQSLEYLQVVQQQWISEFFRAQQALPGDFSAATIRFLQQTVIDAHVLERRLIKRLETLG